MENYITIHGLKYSIASCEAQGLSACLQAYADYCAGEFIMEVGFNPTSGYVYIALDNGVTICSMLGRGVDYLVVNFMDGEETFYDSYEEALEHDFDNANNTTQE